jgi:hypothetical protein
LIHLTCLFLCQYHAVFVVMALKYSSKSGIVMCPALDLLLRISLSIRGLLCFHMYFMIAFSISVQNVIGILIGTALKTSRLLLVMCIFTMLSLPIYEYGSLSVF